MVKETREQDRDIIDNLAKSEWIEKAKQARLKQVALSKGEADGNTRISEQ
jgi:uncharacterized protein YutE (UPF0331/DUF86 family)